MPSEFVADKALLNPKFEGYKLDPLDTDHCVAHFPLPGEGISQSTVKSTTQQYSQPTFHEVRNRIRHNHLSRAFAGNSAGYVDKTGTFIIISYDFSTNTPSFHRVFEIPPIISSAPNVNSNEYPVACALTPDIWLVSDGAGRLFIIRVTAGNSGLNGELVGYVETTESLLGSSSSHSLTPIWIFDAFMTSSTETATLQVVVAAKVRVPISAGIPTTKQKYRFQISSLSIPLANGRAPDPLLTPITPIVGWSVYGEDLPHAMAKLEGEGKYAVFASSQFHPSLTPRPSNAPRDPLPEEIAPIPRAGENLDGPSAAPPIKVPLYSWSQVGDSITVAFFLPASTPKSHIRITLSARSLSLHIIDPPEPPAGLSSLLQIPFFEKREWWDGIDSSASFWTWEKDGDMLEDEAATTIDGKKKLHNVGVLTLYLEKQHEDTRWAHLFSDTQPKPPTASHHGEQDDDVPETLDPTQLLATREALEKYTAALATGEDASGLGLGTGVPSLARREEDEELDEDVGRLVVCTWMSIDNGMPPEGTDRHELGWPHEILSLPIPTSSSLTSLKEWSPIIRQDIDGLYFRRDANAAEWKHAATFPALSFVLASKRDTRFAFHIDTRAVFAFESGSSGPGSGNVYIYRGTPGKEIWSKQAVLKISGGTAGALLGVVALVDETRGEGEKGSIVLAALCEKELAIAKDVL